MGLLRSHGMQTAARKQPSHPSRQTDWVHWVWVWCKTSWREEESFFNVSNSKIRYNLLCQLSQWGQWDSSLHLFKCLLIKIFCYSFLSIMKELSFLRVGWACSPWLQSVWAGVECIPPTWRPATSSRSPTATDSTCCSQKGLGRKDPLGTLSEIYSLPNQWRVWLSWECFPVSELLVTLTHFTFFSPVIVSKGV